MKKNLWVVCVVLLSLCARAQNYTNMASSSAVGGISTNGDYTNVSSWQPAGTNLALIATPNAVWLFMGWSGNLIGDYAQTNTTLLMNADKSITATFSNDADDDGLTNTQENSLGTDPRDTDSDDDGLLDAFEVYIHNTDPLDADTDDDSLYDGLEVSLYEKDPLVFDSDGDGLGDYAEVNTHLTDPNDADSDDDGLSDGAEVNTHGTDPNDADSVNDGLSDGLEINTYNTNPHLGDTSGDGIMDGYAVLKGLDPTVDETGIYAILNINKVGFGEVTPDSDLYTYGTNITLQATGTNDMLFASWSGSITGDYTAAITNIILNGHMDITATFSDDADGDGILNTNETALGTNPLNSDTDWDGLSDSDELYTYYTDPLVRDGDGDGLSDGAEILTYYSDPNAIDTDLYGFSDGYEVDTGYDPALASSTPEAVMSIYSAVEINFNAASGSVYRIEGTDSLTNSWVTLANQVATNVLDIADLRIDVDSIDLSSDGVVLVDQADTDVLRYANLTNAYITAKALTPNGQAISATNRATVMIPPGTYDGGTNVFTLDAEYVDLIALVPEHRSRWWKIGDFPSFGRDYFLVDYRPTSTVIEGEGQTVIIQAVSNVNLVGFTVFNYSPDDENANDKMPFTVRVNNGAPDSYYEKLYFHAVNPPAYSGGTVEPINPMYEQNMAGTWIDCTASIDFMWRGGFSKNLNCYTSPTMVNCHAGLRSFGGDWNEPFPIDCKFTNSYLLNCSSTSEGFGGCGTWGLSADSSAWFVECETGDRGFGFGAIAGGNYIRCKGGLLCFGGTAYDNAQGVNTNLTGSFTGYAEDCVGGGGSFGGAGYDAWLVGNQGKLSGTMVRCFVGADRKNNVGDFGWLLEGAYIDSCYFQGGLGGGTGTYTFTLLDSSSTIINSTILNIEGDTAGAPITAAFPQTVTLAGNTYNNLALFPSGLGPNVSNDGSLPDDSVPNNHFGKVLNIIAIGQSNLTGITGTNSFWDIEHPVALTVNDAPELDRTLILEHWNGMLQRANVDSRPYFGPEAYMLYTLRNKNHYTVMTKTTVVETQLDAFLEDGSVWIEMTNDYNKLLAQAAAPFAQSELSPLPAKVQQELALTTTNCVDILLFGQGESYQNHTNTVSYYVNLVALIESVKTYFNSPGLKILFMGMNHYYDEYPSHTAHISDAAFKRYVTEHPDSAVYIYTKDLSVRSDLADLIGEKPTDVHYSQWGERDLGVRLAHAVRRFYNEPPGKNGIVSSGSEDRIDLSNLFDKPGAVYSVIFNSNPDLVSLEINESGQLELTYTPEMTGTAAVTIAANYDDSLRVESTLAIEVVPAPETKAGNLVLNSQTGLYEQNVTITNNSMGFDAYAVKLKVKNLPEGTSLFNATGTDSDGNYEVRWNGRISPSGSMDFLLQYHTPFRSILPSGIVEASMCFESLPFKVYGGTVPVLGQPQGIDSEMAFLLEFSAEPEIKYYIQYTDSLIEGWTTVLPEVVSQANRIQWLDRGPPETASAPGEASSRFYRVIRVD